MTRSVFYGVSAFVGSIVDATTCTFWADDPGRIGFNAQQFQFNLANNPEAVRRGTIQASQVEVDDYEGYGTRGMTSIGPMFTGGAMMGLCYVEDSHCAVLGQWDPRQPGSGPGQPYEWCTVIYYDTNGGDPAALVGRRFYGFYAQMQKLVGTYALVSLWARGTSGTKPAMGTWWIDLATYGHPAAPAISTYTQITAPGQSGALFLDARAGHGGVVPFDKPKTPKSQGGVVPRNARRAR
jgi:hypothetical protein